MKFYTYIYRDPSRNNEPIYIGKGKKNRAWDHLRIKRKNPFIQRLQLMKKNNIVPSIEIIDALDESHAFLMEESLIEIIGRKDLGRGSLLNLTDGGEGVAGILWGHDRKEKWSCSRKDNNPMLGKTQTIEARISIGKSQPKKRNYTEESRKSKSDKQRGDKNPAYIVGNKPRPITYNNVYYPSVAEASRQTGISPSAIRCHLKKNTYD